ncbi:uncharacterized protein LOC123610403 [Leopardus geoffroyi]|uniref:uncharacterized protein LOC123610403 n=1 Tax=Leopardus geoffroyi TaxID=46844 RepID=UPI001E2601FF|nr:uncharacterized protein LOC123610403 [Leopardus geoffroyi]
MKVFEAASEARAGLPLWGSPEGNVRRAFSRAGREGNESGARIGGSREVQRPSPRAPDLLSRPPDLRGRCPSGAGRVIGSCRSSRGTRVSRTRGRRRRDGRRPPSWSPGGSRWVGGSRGRSRGLRWAAPSLEETAAGGGGGSGLPPSGAAPGRTATVTARPPLPAVRFLLEPQASAGTLGGRGGARHATASGELGSGETGLHPPLAQAARPSGGASARPESSGLPPLPLFLSPRNLPIILPPRLERCARRARNKHHI